LNLPKYKYFLSGLDFSLVDASKNSNAFGFEVNFETIYPKYKKNVGQITPN